MLRRMLLPVLLAFTLAGCIEKSGVYSETRESDASKSTAINAAPIPGRANLYLYRSFKADGAFDFEDGIGREVVWRVNDQQVGGFTGTGFLKLSIVPGDHKVQGWRYNVENSSAETFLNGVSAGDNVYVRYSHTAMTGLSVSVVPEERARPSLQGLAFYRGAVEEINERYVSDEERRLASGCRERRLADCVAYRDRFPEGFNEAGMDGLLAGLVQEKEQRAREEERRQREYLQYVRTNPVAACQDANQRINKAADGAFSHALEVYEDSCQWSVDQFYGETLTDWQRNYYQYASNNDNLVDYFDGMLRCFDGLVSSGNAKIQQARKLTASVEAIPGCRAEEAEVTLANAEAMLDKIASAKSGIAQDRGRISRLNDQFHSAYHAEKERQRQAMMGYFVNRMSNIGNEVNATMQQIQVQTDQLWELKRQSDRQQEIRAMKERQLADMERARQQRLAREREMRQTLSQSGALKITHGNPCPPNQGYDRATGRCQQLQRNDLTINLANQGSRDRALSGSVAGYAQTDMQSSAASSQAGMSGYASAGTVGSSASGADNRQRYSNYKVNTSWSEPVEGSTVTWFGNSGVVEISYRYFVKTGQCSWRDKFYSVVRYALVDRPDGETFFTTAGEAVEYFKNRGADPSSFFNKVALLNKLEADGCNLNR